MATFGCAEIMRAAGSGGAAGEEECWKLVARGVYVDGAATLESAMPMFEKSGAAFVPVVSLGEGQAPVLRGAVFYVDALRELNRALAATAAEEHS